MQVWRGVLRELGGFFQDAFYGGVFGVELAVGGHCGLGIRRKEENYWNVRSE